MNANTCSVVSKPGARCIGGRFCSVCQPDYILALAMGLHPRLGEESPVAMLTAELLRMIIDMTRYKWQLPAWLSCDWDVKMQKRRRAIKVLKSSRAAKLRREHERVDGD